jgi:signal transduction histidine kinase
VLAVIPWQYVVPDGAVYGHNLNSLYLIEKVAFLSGLVLAWKESKSGWRTIYASLFGACIIYGASSYLANWALDRHSYYSGSLYDIPLAVSMTWITLIGLWTRAPKPRPAVRSASTAHGVWLARLGMIAAFSLPLFAAWALLDGAVPGSIRSFRVVLTLGTALLMGGMVFTRQSMLDRELVRLLTESRESFANLKRLQVQITESEKLASIGQLVGGAAHELNNPIAAMLGYSDLLQSTTLNPEQHELADKIGQHVRRTKSLVASLLSFAKQGPAAMAPVDLNTILRTAIKLTQPQWQALKIEMHAELQPNLPLVLGDSNQLLQVCVQIFNNALHTADRRTARTLAITAEHKEGLAIIEISDSGGTENPSQNEEDQSLSNLGLSACQGILHQHRGRIICQQDWHSGTAIRIELPVIPRAQGKSTRDGAPAMWQPQPFA